MDEQKVIEELGKKYPGKRILINPGEIVCETAPAINPGAQSVAVAVIDKSVAHYHKKTVETYKILKGKATVIKNEEAHELRPGDELTINPGEIHCATGDETWVKIVAVPGWTSKDHFLWGD